MKKIGLVCATLLVGLSLAGCNNMASQSHRSSSSSSSTTKMVKHHKTHRQIHKNQGKKKAKAGSSLAHNPSTVTSSNSESVKKEQTNSQATQTTISKAGPTSSNASNNNSSESNDYEVTDSYNGNYSRFRNGTRKPSTFSNSQDYQAYLAYYQGYNYDKSTGQITRMNEQQLNDMRQQMNKDGGQSFGQ